MRSQAITFVKVLCVHVCVCSCVCMSVCVRECVHASVFLCVSVCLFVCGGDSCSHSKRTAQWSLEGRVTRKGGMEIPSPQQRGPSGGLPPQPKSPLSSPLRSAPLSTPRSTGRWGNLLCVGGNKIRDTRTTHPCVQN